MTFVNETTTSYPSNLALKGLVFIHRHGARSPIFTNKHFPSIASWSHCHSLPGFYKAFHTIKNDHVELDMDFHGDNALKELEAQLEKVKGIDCFPGQLTDEGKKGMESIGKEFRTKYVEQLGFLPKNWNVESSDISLRSTNYLRTIESLQFLLNGIYPNIKSNGIPKVIVKESKDESMYPNPTCDSMTADTKVLRDAYNEKHQHRLISVLNPLSSWHTMENTSNANKSYRLYDMLSCLMGNSVDFPEGVTENHYGELESLTVDLWARLYEKDDHFTRRAIGRFLPEMVKSFQDLYQSKPNTPKLSIFSGHDSTLIPILISMKAFQGSYPRFGANITLEYFENISPISKLFSPKESYIRMLYNGTPLKIPACQAKGSHYKKDESLCTFQAFMKQVENMSLTESEYQAACHSDVKVVPLHHTIFFEFL
ncbi:histidine phosphatase superfamily [Globomyces pollinis-pini]|nr:histidine phosphatase superfamily [Globomyces pollinis-pini]